MDLMCLSHLRWDFVYQRPNHLMARAAAENRVFFIEEPVRDGSGPRLEMHARDGVTVVVPHLPDDDPIAEPARLRALVDGLVGSERIRGPVLWYYTPMALPWTEHLHPSATALVYDCMDHLAGFHGAPDGLLAMEEQLIEAADVVFTGGASLQELKRRSHRNVHCFPSSVDSAHFRKARAAQPEPDDQAGIGRPRIGYFGVIDERLDMELIAETAARRPDWQLVLVGPTAKIDPGAIPAAPNVHWLGPKTYGDLPAYLAGWDVAMMPFARNDATRFISPTKTPEYLAGGRPVASTSIRDVVTPYADMGLVHIGDTPEAFVSAVEDALAEDVMDLRRRADAFLRDNSWDRTWAGMQSLLDAGIARRRGRGRERPAPTDRDVSQPVQPAIQPAAAPVLAGAGRGTDR